MRIDNEAGTAVYNNDNRLSVGVDAEFVYQSASQPTFERELQRSETFVHQSPARM